MGAGIQGKTALSVLIGIGFDCIELDLIGSDWIGLYGLMDSEASPLIDE